MILDGKVASAAIKDELKNKFEKLGRKATLAIVHFNDPSSQSYLKGRKKLAEYIGIEIDEYPCDENITKEELISLVEKLNKKDDGIIIDRPLPKHLDENEILNHLDSNKDVDGFTTTNLGKLFKNEDCFYPATAYAAYRLLEFYGINVTGKNALVVGRSVNVGKPLSTILLNKNATVTTAHSKTTNLKELANKADIVFMCIGRAEYLTKEYVNPNTIVVDIGINFDNEGKLVGDASRELYDYLETYSPVPGGVGVLTNVVLFENLYNAIVKNG